VALDFDSAGSSRRVNFGQAASIDDLHHGGSGFTAWAWCYFTTPTNNSHIITKDGAGPVGWALFAQANGAIDVRVWRPTPTAFTSSAGVLGAAWTFVAFTFDDAASPKVKIYAGSRSATVAETTYSLTTAGAGALTSDAAVDLYVGNLARATTFPFRGKIDRGGVVNRALTLAELTRIQFASIGQANVSGSKLIYLLNGTGTQPDYSGNLNNGTVTGATAIAGVPLGAPFGGRADKGQIVGGGSVASAPLFAYDRNVSRAAVYRRSVW
jgi:hypothetical protein